MEKTFLIEQPPISKKYRLLIDDSSENRGICFTTDVDKVNYNLKILGVDLSLDTQIHNALSKDGITSIFSLGRYVAILRIKKDETVKEFWFVDFELDIDFEEVNKTTLNGYFSDELIKNFNELREKLRASFSEEYDMIELVFS